MVKLVSGDPLNDPVLAHVRTDFVRISVKDSVDEALSRVRQSRTEGRIVYFYVVDEADRLQGVVPTRELLLKPPDTPVAEIMERRLVTLRESATLLDACESFILHRLLALPVVDKDRRILGVVDVEVYTDELSDLAHREENEDVFQLIGVHLTRVRQASVPGAFRGRFPWLLCNIGGGLACALLGAIFADVLGKVIVLALFIPIVLALAESVSIQSLTLSIQIHEPRRFRWRDAMRLAGREAAVGALLGIACGGLVGWVAWWWQQHLAVALCILLSIALAVATAALLGLAVPVALRAIQRDPKVASGPIALAMTDVATLFYYFALAAWMLG